MKQYFKRGVIMLLMGIIFVACTTTMDLPFPDIKGLNSNDYLKEESAPYLIYLLKGQDEGAIKKKEEMMVGITDSLKPGQTTKEEIIRVLGAPTKIFLVHTENGKYHYNYFYGEGSFYFGTENKVLIETRFEDPRASYAFKGKIRVGSPLEEVTTLLGEPEEIISGENQWKANVLYKDIDSTQGDCYISYPDYGVRFFFSDYRVCALYING